MAKTEKVENLYQDPESETRCWIFADKELSEREKVICFGLYIGARKRLRLKHLYPEKLVANIGVSPNGETFSLDEPTEKSLRKEQRIERHIQTRLKRNSQIFPDSDLDKAK
jgi:hypothetical protein